MPESQGKPPRIAARGPFALWDQFLQEPFIQIESGSAFEQVLEEVDDLLEELNDLLPERDLSLRDDAGLINDRADGLVAFVILDVEDVVHGLTDRTEERQIGGVEQALQEAVVAEAAKVLGE